MKFQGGIKQPEKQGVSRVDLGQRGRGHHHSLLLVLYVNRFTLMWINNWIKGKCYDCCCCCCWVASSCPTLWPHRRQPTRLPSPGILQARTLERVTIAFSNVWKWEVKGKSLSRVRLFATPWTAAHQAPPSMGLSRQEYWSRVPLPSRKKCVYP